MKAKSLSFYSFVAAANIGDATAIIDVLEIRETAGPALGAAPVGGITLSQEEANKAGIYEIRAFVQSADYRADMGPGSQAIWSIGCHRESGKIYASVDTRFYQHPDYTCLWLR